MMVVESSENMLIAGNIKGCMFPVKNPKSPPKSPMEIDYLEFHKLDLT